MGQLSSSETKDDSLKHDYSESELRALFQARAASLLSKGEIAAVASRVNMKDTDEADAVLTLTDLAALLNLSQAGDNSTRVTKDNSTEEHEGEEDVTNPEGHSLRSEESHLDALVAVLYRSFTILGRLPFLSNPISKREQLTMRQFVLALAVHLGGVAKVWPDFDYLKILFISLALIPSNDSQQETDEKAAEYSKDFKSPTASAQDDKEFTLQGPQRPRRPQQKNTIGQEYEAKYSVELNLVSQETTEPIRLASRRIKWESFMPLCNYDGIDVTKLSVSSNDLLQLFILLLMAHSIPSQSHTMMQRQIWLLISQKWTSFEAVAYSLLRYIDLEITPANRTGVSVSYEAFKHGMENAMSGVVEESFRKLVKTSLLLSSVGSLGHNDQLKSIVKDVPSKAFNSTRLVNEATISLLSLFAEGLSVDVKIMPQNMVELYNGAQSGFSIRSLELKIFKWQAPTILLVSGKRLRNKTILKNRRYQQFDLEYPRHFRSSEDPKKSWQSDNDKITYAVFVKQPWRNSNKTNFGDEESTIMCLLPRFDIFKSKRGQLLAGRLIYFNNQGMGIGFGNEQPVNKNNTRRHLPGSVSLTIEANLEFGIFRHIVNAGANTPRFFKTSSQDTVRDQDYEDRFMITDLEVWGVGSTKELDEQRKQWEWEEKQAQARQGVNLRNLGEERAFLEMAGLVGNQGSGGSV
ncbi:hypothetical protein HF325_004873 [Metschnikowia pulcherrima]|uniref:TLDc domain-containing protein n=1 Tax=Metschnikowia pulcherrima TaxID=27326 RepID=A0A8H7GRB3_9ASCO|nr:hypothetical protein HF325_004873 [Metschnikowia pulcherrima]